MAQLFSDPLLSVTRKLLRFCYIVLFAVAALVVLLALIGLVVGDHVSPYAEHLPKDGHGGVLFLLSAAPLMAIYGWFLRILRQLVDTVAAATPFVAANADRLARMGWLAVGLKLIVVAEGLLMRATTDQLIPMGTRFDGPSLLMILVLFILARVFRQGAAMGEDLEGTV